jgi:hypothetical protein
MSRKEEVLSAFQVFQNALLSNDTEILDSLLAPDYRGYSIRGELEDRDAVLGAFGPGGVSMEEFSTENLLIDIRGDVGIVTGRGFVRGTFQGEEWQHYLHFCDLYEETGGRWKIFLSHGMEVDPPAAGPEPGAEPIPDSG